MPWYKAGTVSVAQNSNAVTGVGTAFIANSRVGDAFLGPDGRWYEVTNIASDTAMAISPNYLGATAGAGTYALAPMQGYVKDSADALRALVNQFGTKLAALGTTGNYDTLPVNKGGTGGNDQATARAGLGLGAVATEGVVPVAKGGTGSTSPATARTALGLGTVATAAIGTALGQVPVIGQSFGLGDASVPNSSWNNNLKTGFSSYAGPATGGPTFNGGSWFSNAIDIVYGVDPSVKTQIAMRVNSADFAMRSINMNLANASPWVYFWNTGNTTVDGSGFIKKASPIVRISDPSKSTRPDLNDGFTEAGFGTVNDEALGVSVERIALGRYLIHGSLGLAKSGWQVNSPSDRNGGKLLGLAIGSDMDDGTVLIEFRKIKYTITDDGDLEQVPGALIEAPTDNWIDVRIDMPAPKPYDPPPLPEQVADSVAYIESAADPA